MEEGGSLEEAGSHESSDHMALTTLFTLEATIAARQAEAGQLLAAGEAEGFTSHCLLMTHYTRH